MSDTIRCPSCKALFPLPPNPLESAVRKVCEEMRKQGAIVATTVNDGLVYETEAAWFEEQAAALERAMEGK